MQLRRFRSRLELPSLAARCKLPGIDVGMAGNSVVRKCPIARRGRCIVLQACLSLAILVVSTANPAAMAAETPNRELVRVISLEIEPGKQQVFEAFVAQVRAAYVLEGGGNAWQMASTAIGENIIYTAAFAFSDWADLAPPARNVMLDAYGAEAAATALAGFDAAVVAQDSAVYRYLPAYSRELPLDSAAPELQANVIIELRPSKVDAYLSALELVREARIRAGSPAFWGVYAGSLGASNRLVISYRITDWSTLNDPPGPLRGQLVAAFGEVQAEKTMAAMEAAEVRVETRLMQIRPELSYAPVD